MRLVLCNACTRHVRADEPCPFCAAPATSARPTRLPRAVIASLIGASIGSVACYGGPRGHLTEARDSPATSAQPDTSIPSASTTVAPKDSAPVTP